MKMLIKYIQQTTKRYLSNMDAWVKSHTTGLFVFNIIVILMVLLNTAQYFKPFFYLGINTIFFISLILSTVLLGAGSKTMFFISLIFLTIGFFLKIVKIDIWADRASIYFYQSFSIGILLLLTNKNSV